MVRRGYTPQMLPGKEWAEQPGSFYAASGGADQLLPW
jgi:hypothetical protein